MTTLKNKQVICAKCGTQYVTAEDADFSTCPMANCGYEQRGYVEDDESTHKEMCRCDCGYRCGGPGVCSLEVMDCLQQETGHFTRDCDHDFSGPMKEFSAGTQSVVCQKCQLPAINHDMAVGP